MKSNENNRFDESRQIDDLFRQGLSDLRPEPSKDLWKGISRRLWWDEISHFTFTNLSSVLWIGGFAGLAVIISVVVIATIPQSAVTNGIFVQNLGGTSNSLSGEFKSSVSGATPTNALYIRKSENESDNSKTDQSFLTASLGNSFIINQKHTNKVFPSGSLTFTEPEEISSANAYLSENSNSNTSEETGLSYIQSISSPGFYFSPPTDTLRLITPEMILIVPKEPAPPVSFFSADLGLSPEAIFINSNGADQEMNFYGTAGISYHLDRFSLRSGIGLGSINSDGIYKIDYKSKDSVGFYNTVISYAYSQSNPGEIVYITQTTVVYDSIRHIADDRTRNRYTYLQIPLIAGFRVFETRRIGLTIEAGPMVSFLVGKKEAEPVINFQNARIIRVDNNTPDRNKINWQLYTGLRFDYQFSKHISLFAEPYYKYYFDQLTIQAENKKSNPYALGIGVGIQYCFGQKHQ